MASTLPGTRMDTAAVLALIGLMLATPVLGWLVVSQPQLITLGVIGVIGGIVLLLRVNWCAYLLAIAYPFNTVYASLGFAYLGLGDVATLACVAVWAIHRLARPGRGPLPRAWLFIPAYMALCYISLKNGVSPGQGFGPFVREITYAGAALVLLDLVRTWDQARRILLIVAGSSLAHALIALALHKGGRLESYIGQPNIVGHLIALGVIPTIALLQSAKNNLTRAALFLAINLMVLSVVMTISRGTFVALAVGVLWWVRRSRAQVAMILVLGLTGTVVTSQVEQEQTQILQSRLDFQRDVSVHHRTDILRDGLAAIAARPLLGVGFGQFGALDRALDNSRSANRGAHNYYLTVAATVGLPGLLLFLGLCAWIARRMWRLYKQSVHLATPDGRAAALITGQCQSIILFIGTALMTKGDVLGLLWFYLGFFGAVANFKAPAPPPEPTPAPDETARSPELQLA